jgi:hypothetical protein
MRTRAERARFGNRTEALSGLGVEEEEERWLGVEGRHCEFEGAVESRMQMWFGGTQDRRELYLKLEQNLGHVQRARG